MSAPTTTALKINLHPSFQHDRNCGQIGADGGETSLNNLVLLCRHHHRLVHEGGFACERSETGHLVFRDERGEIIGISGTVPALPTITDNPKAQQRIRNRLEDLHMDAQTCVTKWDGEPADYHFIIGLLWNRDFPEY